MPPKNSCKSGKSSLPSTRVERHREAAKSRRHQESEEIARLANLLPFPTDALSRMDKSTILRLTIAFLQTSNLAETCQESTPSGVESGQTASRLLLETIEGFLILVTKDGNILYVSDQVSNWLGFHAYEMAGGHISEFVPEKDCKIFMDQFSKHRKTDKYATPEHKNYSNTAQTDNPYPGITSGYYMFLSDWMNTGGDLKREFIIRMRYKTADDATKAKHTGYITLQWMGRLQMMNIGPRKRVTMMTPGMVAICRPTISITLRELPMYERTFVMRYAPGNKCTYCDDRIAGLMGYEPTELIGSSLWEFYHPDDFELKIKCYKNIWQLGHEIVGLFRMINKMGRWVWLRTRCLMIYGPKKNPLFVMGMHQIVSEKDAKDLVGLRHPGSCLLGERMSASDPFITGNWETLLKQKTFSLTPPDLHNVITFSEVAERQRALMSQLSGSPESVEQFSSSSDEPPSSCLSEELCASSSTAVLSSPGGLSGKVDISSGCGPLNYTVRAAVPLQSLNNTVQGAVSLQSLNNTVQGAVPLQSLHNTVQAAVPLQSLSNTVQTAVPLQSLNNTVQAAVPLQSLNNTVQAAVPLQSLNNTVRAAVPLQSLNNTVRAAVPLQSLNNIMQGAVPLQSLNNIMQEAVPLQSLNNTVQETVPLQSLYNTVQAAVPLQSLGFLSTSHLDAGQSCNSASELTTSNALVGLPDDLSTIELDSNVSLINGDVDMIDIVHDLKSQHGSTEDDTCPLKQHSHMDSICKFVGNGGRDALLPETLYCGMTEADHDLHFYPAIVAGISLKETQTIAPKGDFCITSPGHKDSMSSDDGYCGSACSGSPNSQEVMFTSGRPKQLNEQDETELQSPDKNYMSSLQNEYINQVLSSENVLDGTMSN